MRVTEVKNKIVLSYLKKIKQGCLFQIQINVFHLKFYVTTEKMSKQSCIYIMRE